MFKSQLHEFAQKAGLLAPVYKLCKEGPSHEPNFRASVSINGNTYDSTSGFTTVKAAEHAAAKAALEALLQSGCGAGVVPIPVHESGLCKSMLQEHAQRSNLSLPVYHIARSGGDHPPTFTTTVVIGDVCFSGGPAKSKRESEIKAARTALIAIQTQSGSTALTIGPLAEFSQGKVGSSTIICSSLPANGLKKKRGRGPQDGTGKGSRAKVEDFLSPATCETVQGTHESSIQHEYKQDIHHDSNLDHKLSQENELQCVV